MPVWFMTAPANEAGFVGRVVGAGGEGGWGGGWAEGGVRVGGEGVPGAVLGLWQVWRRVLFRLWLKAAPANEAVLLWQVSQAAVVAMWVGGLPSAALPL